MPKKKCREEGEKKFFLVRFLGKHALCSRRRRRLPITILRVRGKRELGFQKSCSPLLLQQQRTELSKKFFPSTRSTLDVAPVRRRAHSLVNVRGGTKNYPPPRLFNPPSLPVAVHFRNFVLFCKPPPHFPCALPSRRHGERRRRTKKRALIKIVHHHASNWGKRGSEGPLLPLFEWVGN